MLRRLPIRLILSVLLFAAFMPYARAADRVHIEHEDFVVRLAMDLKGTRPSLDELASSTEETDSLVDGFMETEEFAQRMMWLANDIFLTHTDEVEYFMNSYDYGERRIRYQVAKAVGEEPLRLFTYIVRNDLPLTELVTADYTVANSTLAWFWNIDYPGAEDSDRWLRGRYLDGREHAGVLSQTSLYYRYPNTLSNKWRHRANQITRIFLGDDHLMRNVSIDLRPSGNDPDLDLSRATLTNRGCVVCHDSLDGIGAHVMGFPVGPERHSLYARENFASFSKQGVQRAQMETGREPSYYGYPSRGLHDLGNYIANDSRFARTMVKHFCRFFLHRDLDYRDRDLVTGLTEVLVSSGFSPKALIKAIVTSEENRTVGTHAKTAKEVVMTGPEEGRSKQPNPASTWRDFEKQVAGSTEFETKEREALLQVIRLHAMQTGFSLQRAKQASLPATGDTKNSPKTISPPPDSEIVQPFKLATPEQLHSLGLDLLGEVWDGREGGQYRPSEFPTLEYNTDVKVAAGGYDGAFVLERRWPVPPTYLLVLERWAEVLAEDIYYQELYESVPWGERRVFKVITGKEEPLEAEPSVRLQIASWFKRFYNEDVSSNGPEVGEVFDLLLELREEHRERFGTSRSLLVAWQHVLEVLLCDPRIALY